MTIEKLTKDERGWLESDPEYQQWDVRRKVLRIIDAQAAENEQYRTHISEIDQSERAERKRAEAAEAHLAVAGSGERVVAG